MDGLRTHCSSPGKNWCQTELGVGAGGGDGDEAVELQRSEQTQRCPVWSSGKLGNE